MVVEVLRNFVQAHSVEHHVSHIVYDIRGDFIEYEQIFVVRVFKPAISGERAYVLAVAPLHVKHFPNLL